MRSRGLAEPIGVVLAAFLLACLLTYPIAAQLGSVGRVDNNDGRWSIWVVSWVAHSLTTDPLNTYHANIFYPHDNALTFSEANLVEGAIGAPVWLVTKNPYATHNFVVLVGFTLSAIGAYYFIRYLTGNRYSAAIAAVLFAYCPYVFARTAHIQLLMIWGLPFCLLAFHRLIDRPGPRRGIELGVMLWIQGLTCAYYGIFAGMLVGLGTLFFALTRKQWRNPKYWIAIGIALVVCVGLTAPFFMPYLEMQRETGFGRTIADATRYSANWPSWFASASWVHRQWLPLLQDEHGRNQFLGVVFPGIITLIGGFAGIYVGLSGTDRSQRDVTLFYAMAGGLAFWIALGPTAKLYLFLHDHAPLFSFLRAPERTGLVVTLCLVVLASIAITHFVSNRRSLGLTLFALAVAELVQAPLFTRNVADYFPDSPAYETLTHFPKAPVAEFPYWAESANFHGHAEYMLRSTTHWFPLINGYSDHIPQDFRDDAQSLRSFPTVGAFKTLEKYQARYVVMHMNLVRDGRDDVTARLASFAPYLQPLSKEGDIWLYEIVGWPR
jgi:hypothetical protein